ncbi:MAG: hypothetical protein JO334_17530 [Verrucomicrobia bacterium]|nr:hypothetical protein [Verrucomicrobiota bacterium]
MPVPTDLRTLCSALEHFHLPAALGSLRNNCLVAWNPLFREMAGLSEAELVEVKLTSLIALDESNQGVQNGDSEKAVEFVPCALKQLNRLRPMPGSALRRDDGLLLVILNFPGGDLAFQDLIRGRLIGQEEEKNRTRQFLHDILSSKLLIASFATHEVYQRLAASGAEGSQELAMVTKLLEEVIDAITDGFEEQLLRSDSIPDSEAATLQV